MAKKVDLKAKAKRQKMIAAGGGVLLIAVLAFQVPRTMKMLSAEPPPPAPVAVAPGTTVPSDPSVLPTPGTVGGGASPAASGDGTLVDSDPKPVAANGQLISFGRFSSKDPFVEQIDETQAGGTGGSTPTPSSPGTTPVGGVVPVSPTAGSPAVSGSAVISVNGVQETVAAGGEFPKESPVFRLVKVVGGEARIGIAGGALASGSPTVTLRKGKAVTLVNTADGTRYELKLVSVG
ncbi:MAG: hypothetical protein QOI67_1529 [Gaiellaceae bacterium]|jgi:hypothetical protein|nr:hypothetical protein [Gaiellaceae bacterium]